ncbi:MAG TPA: ribosome silencing factor [Oscillospiraceae bacterium]|nr:ribosome silencing factor [Oscillospiraceae bacterium]
MSQEVHRLLALIVNAAEDKKAVDLTILDIGKVSFVADYFVIATGTTKTQVHAIADSIMEKLKESDDALLHREGYQEGLWILLDYGSVVVHIFQPEQRNFYHLERLWAHAPKVTGLS